MLLFIDIILIQGLSQQMQDITDIANTCPSKEPSQIKACHVFGVNADLWYNCDLRTQLMEKRSTGLLILSGDVKAENPMP